MYNEIITTIVYREEEFFMSHFSKTFKDIQNECKFRDVSIRQDTFVCHQVYGENVNFSMLYSHKPIEISIVVSGSGIHQVLSKAIPCKAGDIYIVNSNVPHRYFASEEGEGVAVRRLLFEPEDWFYGEYAMTSSPNFCYGLFSENPISVYAMLTNQVMQKILLLCDGLETEILEKKNEWQSALKANLSLILITLKRYVNTSLKNTPITDPVTWNPISAAIALVNENYGDANMTLESIAESFYISKSQLSRLFKQLTGTSFSTYLKNIRLSKACELLVDTDITVDNIMKACGMRDATSFYKAFGEYTGLTPNQYRKENNKGETNMNILTEISENLQKGRSKVVKELVQTAIDEGIDAKEILSSGLLSGMSIIGEKFKNNKVYVPEVLVAARAMNAGTELLKPLLAENGVEAKGKVCIGTVQGDLHDIGKNLVKMMMEGKGLEVIDLGTDVSAKTFVQTAIEQNCQVICCSALLTTTMPVMDEVVKEAEKAGIRDKVKIMVGGAPVNEEYCKKIGADCYTVDAASAADAAAEFCKG